MNLHFVTPHVTSLCLFSNTYTTILVIFYLLLPIDAFFKVRAMSHQHLPRSKEQAYRHVEA